MALVAVIVFAFLCPAMGGGAHQHLIAMPDDDAMQQSQRPIWQMIANDYPAGARVLLRAFYPKQVTFVARSTPSQFDYELWGCVTYVDPAMYDPEFFWSTNPMARTWVELGVHSFLYICFLCGIGYGAPWIECRLYQNTYPSERFYGGIAIELRTWKDCLLWWSIDTMSLTKDSMWYYWRSLYLPWEKLGSQYGRWRCSQSPAPTIPIYLPDKTNKHFLMVLKGGYRYDSKVSGSSLVPSDYIKHFMKLRSQKLYPSTL